MQVVNGRQDYVNNDGKLQDLSQIHIGSVLYVGGVSPEVQGSLPLSVCKNPSNIRTIRNQMSCCKSKESVNAYCYFMCCELFDAYREQGCACTCVNLNAMVRYQYLLNVADCE